MIPTLEKNHPQTVGADSIATYGLGSELHVRPLARLPAPRSRASPGDSTITPLGFTTGLSSLAASIAARSLSDTGKLDFLRCGGQAQTVSPADATTASGSQLTYCVEVAAELLADVEEQTVRSVHQAQRSGRESPRAVNRSEAVALAAIPLPSVGFPTFGSRFCSRIIFAVAPVIAASSHCVDDDFLILTRIRRGVNTGYTRCVERPSIIEAGRNLIDNVLDFHEDFITNGNC